MKLRPDDRSETIKKLQNNFTNPIPNSSFSNVMARNIDDKQSALPTSMRVGINYEAFAPKNHLE